MIGQTFVSEGRSSEVLVDELNSCILIRMSLSSHIGLTIEVLVQLLGLCVAYRYIKHQSSKAGHGAAGSDPWGPNMVPVLFILQFVVFCIILVWVVSNDMAEYKETVLKLETRVEELEQRARFQMNGGGVLPSTARPGGPH